MKCRLIHQDIQTITQDTPPIDTTLLVDTALPVMVLIHQAMAVLVDHFITQSPPRGMEKDMAQGMGPVQVMAWAKVMDQPDRALV